MREIKQRQRMWFQWLQKILIGMLMTCACVWAQSDGGQSPMLSSLVSPHDYVQKRASSYDRTGGNDDFYKIKAGERSHYSTTPVPESLRTSGSRSPRRSGIT